MMEIPLKPSARLGLFFIITHTTAMLSLIICAAPLWLKVFAGLICATSLCYLLQRYALLKPNNAITQIVISDDQTWQLTQKNGQVNEAYLQSDSVVTAFMIILNFKKLANNRHFSFLVSLDSVVNLDDFRKLCVHLKTQCWLK